MKHTKQKGFTLIELIIVVVILGILAAVALPRFMNFTTGSREGVLSGIAAALTSTNSLVYAQAAIQGQLQQGNGTVTVPGIDADNNGSDDTVPVRFGYLRSNNAAALAAVQAVLQVNSGAIANNNQIAFQLQGGQVRIGYNFDGDAAVIDDLCFISYDESDAASQLPSINVTRTNC